MLMFMIYRAFFHFLYFVLCSICVVYFFFFKQKTAYEMRISDWSSDVCSSDLSGAMAAGDLCLPRSRRIPSSRPRVPRPRKTELSGRYLAARVAYALVSGARYPAPRISRGDVMLRSMFLGAALLDRKSVV